MRERLLTLAAAAALAGILAVPGTAGAAPSTPAAPTADGTTVASSEQQASSRTGDVARAAASPCWYSSGRWWCNNVSGAPVYRSGTATIVGRMYSNPSWFVCRSDNGGYVGGPHPYRWVWTQADNGAWGWMKDTAISSETNSLPVC